MNNWGGELTIGLGWVYYQGPFGHTDFHQHYAVQICFPFSGSMHLESCEGECSVNAIHVVGSNVLHRFSSSSASGQVLYIEPTLITKHMSRLNINGISEMSLSPAALRILRATLSVAPTQLKPDFGLTIANLLWPQKFNEIDNEAYKPIDERISRALSRIALADHLNIKLESLASDSNLSSSRFRHLFRIEMGMSVKKYLLWCKLQRAFQSLAETESLTRASHMAGFSDSAHLSRTFKKMFGLAPVELNRVANFTTRSAIK